MKRINTFGAIRTEGGLLPIDLLVRISKTDATLATLTPTGYHLAEGERLNEAINRSWNRLVGAWAGFRETLARVSPDDRTATNITRSRWSLVLFQELGYGQLQTAKSPEIDGKTYPISHAWAQVPVHLVGAKVDLDRRTEGVPGAATMSPHGLVQEYLNRSDDHLWGFVTNGLRLRLLRDNAALTRQAFVEFDLESMMEGQEYADFAVLWLLCHQSRLEGDQPAYCALEQWSADAAKQGTRALDQLRGGVETAIAALGTGFLVHPGNAQLREDLRSGTLDKQDYYRQLLRLVYRLLFLFVAEDRELLLDPAASAEARERYVRFYSLSRIRELASRRRGTPHGDLWEQLQVVFSALGRENGAPALGLAGLGSFLWSDDATPALDSSQLPNRHLLEAVLSLSSVSDGKVRRSVDYRNLGSEELGSIYESLLELHPDLSIETRRFSLSTAAGNERKTTGSYYTPTSLINELLDSALEPVLDEAAAKADPEHAILDLKVIDPACGSGHFLIAAAHRIAKRLASVRTGDGEPSPDATRHALRDVVGRCLHGIDLNPMAVELCKVSLWMEAMEPGKPLSFLDHRIVRGNALIGATPDLLDAGVPDDAFKPLTGDDKVVVASLRKRNKKAREGQVSLFGGGTESVVAALAAKAEAVDVIGDDSAHAVTRKATTWRTLTSSPEYQAAVHVADMWCAAFVAPKMGADPAITHEELEIARTHPERVAPTVRRAVEEASTQYGFLHWHLAFLDVYGTKGGFDVVLGNPPWEKVQFTEKEFFAARAPEVAGLAGAKRKAAIAKLEAEDASLWLDYQSSLRQADGESHFIRNSGRFPLCGLGKVNTYAVFAEAMKNAIARAGRLGVIVPTGIATDDTTKHFFADCVTSKRLVSLFDFENAAPVFPGVHRSFKFCLLTVAGHERPTQEAEFVFFAHRTADLADEDRRFTLSPEDLALINPNTKTAPVFRSRRDAEITKAIYRRVPVLVREGAADGNPWGVDFQQGLFNMTSDSHLFRTADDLRAEGAVLAGNQWRRGDRRWVPLYEAKMVHRFNHRFGDYALRVVENAGNQLPEVPNKYLKDPAYVVQPRYWVNQTAVRDQLRSDAVEWLLGFRKTCRATDARTMIPCVIPSAAVGDKFPLINPERDFALLYANLASFMLDYVTRQKSGGTDLSFFIAEQLPVIQPQSLHGGCEWLSEPTHSWIAKRVLELCYTSWDIRSVGEHLGWAGPPLVWEENRRHLISSELDAFFFHRYGVGRDDVDYIMETFTIVRRKDEAAHGEYRTKRLILERYDAMAACIANGTEYQTVLDPPPAHPSLAHPESTRPDWA
jgi:hypothetical protein